MSLWSLGARVLPRGAWAEGQVRRSLSVIVGSEIDVVVLLAKPQQLVNITEQLVFFEVMAIPAVA